MLYLTAGRSHYRFPATCRLCSNIMATSTKSTSLVQRVREQLEDDIVEGRLRPGVQLNVDDIAARFEVSRTPVREALQQLEASGLVVVQPKRGTYVAEVSLGTLIAMFEVMAELEAMCARLAARRADAVMRAELAKVMELCEREATGGDTNSYYRANETFHQLIYQASGNSFLVQQTIALKNRLKPYRRLQLQVRDRMAQSLQEHRALVDSITHAQPDQAADAARAHVLVQGQRFTDLMVLINQHRTVAA